MKTKSLQQVKSAQKSWMTRILSLEELSHENIHRAKKDVCAFFKKNIRLSLETRLVIIGALIKNTDSNKFWGRVFNEVLDCPKDRGSLCRQLLIVVSRVDKERYPNAARTISRALPSPQRAVNTLQPLVRLGSDRAKWNNYRTVVGPTATLEIVVFRRASSAMYHGSLAVAA